MSVAFRPSGSFPNDAFWAGKRHVWKNRIGDRSRMNCASVRSNNDQQRCARTRGNTERRMGRAVLTPQSGNGGRYSDGRQY